MTDTVQIMPKQPIEAEHCHTFGASFVSPSGHGVRAYDTQNVYLGSNWVKVPDPIVWDGEDSTEQRIRDLLMGTRFDAGSDRGEGDPPDDAPLCIWAGDEFHEPVDVLTPGDSITVFGRWPFVIRASEVTP